MASAQDGTNASRASLDRQRPDHSTVPIVHSSPILPPPPVSARDSIEGKQAHQYGAGFTASPYSDSDELLSKSTSKRRALDQERRRPPGGPSALQIILLGLLAIAGTIFALSRFSISPTEHINKRLSPYLPAAFVAFLGSTGVSPKAPHPIIPLLVQANDKWDSLIASQSTTFDRASRQYRSRYGMQPPPGFDKWFAFATQGRNHTLVDEYDGLMTDLLPFRSLSPAELRRRTAELATVPGISIVSIRDGVAQVHSKSGKWAPALAFQQMLAAFIRDLPDMDIAINEKPEGRVLPIRQRVVSLEDYGLDGSDEVTTKPDPAFTHPGLANFTADWGREGSVWDAFRRSCPTTSAARRLVESVRSAEAGTGSGLQVQMQAHGKKAKTLRKSSGQAYPPTRELTFNANVDAAADFCSRPSIHSLHSAFFSDQRSLEHLFPVFSPSKPNGYADILIPSSSYWTLSSEYTYEFELKRGRTKEGSDREWDKKDNAVFWRGKITRGADTPPGRESSFQKQRLVQLANHASPDAKRILVAFDPKTAGLSSSTVPLGQANRAMTDIAMACDPNLGECSYLRSLGYRVEPPGPLSDAWKHKYVLDLDEIGFSPRFLALMESKSAVVKASVQREFWSDWAVPWKHFIPLSSAYSELFNIATFFSGFPDFVSSTNATRSGTTVLTAPKPVPSLPTTVDGNAFEGDRALQDIAEAGRDWRLTHVRKADMECYVYRLMIEWAAMLAEE